MNNEVPSRQEMFNRAWNGIKAQDWRQSAVISNGGVLCKYLMPNGDRCAWGHVDTSVGDRRGTVKCLARSGIGVAAFLDGDDLEFAYRLQEAHDFITGSSSSWDEMYPEYQGASMEQRLRAFAKKEGLTIPDE